MKKFIVIFILSFGGALPCGYGQDQVKFHSTIEEARDASEAAKPMVLYFGASWCAPCQRMKTITLDILKEEAAAKKYQWVKFDIDDSPEVASRYGVVSVPTMVVLDKLENPIGASSGFMTAEKVLQFVYDTIQNPIPIPPSINELARGIEESDDSELDSAVDLLIREMASPNRNDRQRMLYIVKEHKQKIQPRLLELMEDKQLKTRAAAGLAILASHDIPAVFDPFADLPTRKLQCAKIRKLLPKLD